MKSAESQSSSIKSVYPRLPADLRCGTCPWECLSDRQAYSGPHILVPNEDPQRLKPRSQVRAPEEWKPLPRRPTLESHNLLTISAWGRSFPGPDAPCTGRKLRPEAKEVTPGAQVSGLRGARFRRTATFRGSREVGQWAQVPDRQESAFFFSPHFTSQTNIKDP